MKTRLLEREDEEKTDWAWRSRQDYLSVKMKTRLIEPEDEDKIAWSWRWRQDWLSLKMKTRLLEPEDEDKTPWSWKWREDYLNLTMKALRYLETQQTTTQRNFSWRLESSGEYILSTKLHVIRTCRSVITAMGVSNLAFWLTNCPWRSQTSLTSTSACVWQHSILTNNQHLLQWLMAQ